MTATQRRPGNEKPKALALPRGGFAARAEEELYEAGWYGGGEEADREVLGNIAKQLVIAGIPFRLVTVR